MGSAATTAWPVVLRSTPIQRAGQDELLWRWMLFTLYPWVFDNCTGGIPGPEGPYIPDHLPGPGHCGPGLSKNTMPDVEGIEPEVIGKRDGCPVRGALPVAYCFEYAVLRPVRIHTGPGMAHHREGMRIAAPEFRDIFYISDQGICICLAAVQGLDCIEPELRVIGIPEPGMGMRGNGNTAIVADEGDDGID